MRAVIQRVKRASVEVDGEVVSEISQGVLVLLGVEKLDSKAQAEHLVNKILNFRIFEDENAKMNKSLLDIGGELLVVSQFTLASDCKKGKRPSFDNAAKPGLAMPLYEYFIELAQKQVIVKTGQFGAMMDVSLVNDGPVTFVLSKV